MAGGFAGRRPSLTDLHDGDLVHTTDYRAVYDAVLTELWGASTPRFTPNGPPVTLLRKA